MFLVIRRFKKIAKAVSEFFKLVSVKHAPGLFERA
jgi:hypothetical protein